MRGMMIRGILLRCIILLINSFNVIHREFKIAVHISSWLPVTKIIGLVVVL